MTKHTKRDLSRKQFESAMRKLGWKPEGFLGYWGFIDSKGKSCFSDQNFYSLRGALHFFTKKAEELRL